MMDKFLADGDEDGGGGGSGSEGEEVCWHALACIDYAKTQGTLAYERRRGNCVWCS